MNLVNDLAGTAAASYSATILPNVDTFPHFYLTELTQHTVCTFSVFSNNHIPYMHLGED